ncbi:MAG: hypothetical protein SPJ81_01670, partial [Lachnoclostridium sp.]|nr:hypothetical protein [Lachnoclostridium sp.]
MKQEAIEDAVIEFTVKNALTDEMIEAVATAAVELQNQQKEVSVHKQKLQHLSDLNRQIQNYVDAIGNGLYSAALAAKLKEAEEEKEKLSAEIAEESYDHPVFTKDQVVEFMKRFRTGDTKAPEVRRQIVDIFVNSIYLFDDHFDISYNTSRQTDTVPLSAIKDAESVSPLDSLSPPNKHDSFDTKVSETNGGYGITLYDEV